MPSEEQGCFYIPVISPFSQFTTVPFCSYIPAFSIPAQQSKHFMQIDTPSETLQPSTTSA